MGNFTPDAKEEFIHEPDLDDPNWSESYGHWCSSPDNNTALFFHFQRSSEDPDLWRELVIIHCEDGSILVGKSYGKNPGGRDPKANALSVECVKPFEQWQISFDGALRRVEKADLNSGLFTGGIWNAGKISLKCEAHAPLWCQQSAPTSMKGVAKAHFEQPIKFSGSFEFQGESTKVEGLGLRDHSYGSRNIGQAGDAQWFNGQFPSGRCFLISRYTTADGHTFDEAHVTIGDKVLDAKILELSALEHAESGSKMHAVLETELGQHKVEGEFTHAIPVSLLGVREQVPGRDPSKHDYFYWDGSLRYSWEDEVGSGSCNVVISAASQKRLEQG